MSNNDELLGGLGNLLKNIDLSQLTSLMSNLNVKAPEGEQAPLASQFDMSKISSLLSNIDLGQIGSLLSGLNIGQSENEDGDGEGEENSLVKGLNLDALRNFNLEGLNMDKIKDGGLFNIEDLQDALSEFQEKLQGFRKF